MEMNIPLGSWAVFEPWTDHLRPNRSNHRSISTPPRQAQSASPCDQDRNPSRLIDLRRLGISSTMGPRRNTPPKAQSEMINNKLTLDQYSSISAAQQQIGNDCFEGYENKTQKKPTSIPSPPQAGFFVAFKSDPPQSIEQPSTQHHAHSASSPDRPRLTQPTALGNSKSTLLHGEPTAAACQHQRSRAVQAY